MIDRVVHAGTWGNRAYFITDTGSIVLGQNSEDRERDHFRAHEAAEREHLESTSDLCWTFPETDAVYAIRGMLRMNAVDAEHLNNPPNMYEVTTEIDEFVKGQDFDRQLDDCYQGQYSLFS